jgi:hypothetical protein
MGNSGSSGGLFRKWAMKQYWRMQQSQAVVGLLLWGTTITLLLWPYVGWRFDPATTFVGIPLTYFGLASIFGGVMFAVLLIGFLYDNVFSLWTEWRSVDMERNPYATYAQTPNWTMLTSLAAENLKKNAADDEELLTQVDWILNWCSSYSKGEMWGRAVQRWDTDLGPTPTFWFTDEESMQSARDITFEDEA